MLPRVLLVWVSFSVLVLMLGLYSQAAEFEFQHLLLALWLSVPVGVAVMRGGLGEASDRHLIYPSVSLLVTSAWILAVAPSLIVESDAARYLYRYTPIAMQLSRVFFFFWCVVFAYACGKPQLRTLKARATLPDFIGCLVLAGSLALYLIRNGLFSFYQRGSMTVQLAQGGSVESLTTVLSMPLFTLLPPLVFLVLMHNRGRLSHYLLVATGFVGAWGLLFLLGSRTSLTAGLACIFVLCRGLGMRLRANVLIGLGVTMPAVLMLVLVYRNALAETETETTDVSQFITVASDATSTLNDQKGQDNALDLVSNNARVRLWYGQQFCVLVDQWLDEGAALRGTLLSGPIQSLPTLIMNDKNEIAMELNFEKLLMDSQRYPSIDLAPMPWMQWLYELGVLGLLIGTMFYAWLVRLIESRLNQTTSFYEAVFWLHMFVSILAPEHTSDWLVVSARTIFLDIVMIFTMAKIMTWFSHLGRRDIKLAAR